MAITVTDLKTYLAEVMNDTVNNGGRRSTTLAVDGLTGQVWPATTPAERAAGSVKYRKLFLKNDNAADIVLENSRVLLWKPSPTDIEIYIFLGTQTNTQGDLTGSEPLYGAGDLDATVLAGVTSIDVAVEDGTVTTFRDGDLIYISDQVDDEDLVGVGEFVRISGAPSVAGDIVTLPLETPLVNGYSSANTHVSSVIEVGNVGGTLDNKVVTSAAGTFDEAQVTVHNQGSIEDSITLTFTSATAFDITSAQQGSLGSGTIGGGASPTNPDTGTPYWTIAPAAFGGTYAASDSVTFNTHPADVPVFEKRVAPASMASGSGATAQTYLYGEGANV